MPDDDSFDANAYPDFGQFSAPSIDAYAPTGSFDTPDVVGGAPVDVGGTDLLAGGGDSAVLDAAATFGAGDNNDGGTFIPSINPVNIEDGSGFGLGVSQADTMPDMPDLSSVKGTPDDGGQGNSQLSAGLDQFGSRNSAVTAWAGAAGLAAANAVDSRGGTANIKQAGFSEKGQGLLNKLFGSGSPAARGGIKGKSSNMILLAGGALLIFALMKGKHA